MIQKAKNLIPGQTIVFESGAEMKIERVEKSPIGDYIIAGFIEELGMTWNLIARPEYSYIIKNDIFFNNHKIIK